jgi:hypothetical protein
MTAPDDQHIRRPQELDAWLNVQEQPYDWLSPSKSASTKPTGAGSKPRAPPPAASTGLAFIPVVAPTGYNMATKPITYSAVTNLSVAAVRSAPGP